MPADAQHGRAWLAALPDNLAAHQRVMARLLDFCESAPDVTSFSVGCSLGRGAADALSDIDAAIGVAGDTQSVAGDVAAVLPRLGRWLGALIQPISPWPWPTTS
jgi:predicted nucleotidyltransferase